MKLFLGTFICVFFQRDGDSVESVTKLAGFRNSSWAWTIHVWLACWMSMNLKGVWVWWWNVWKVGLVEAQSLAVSKHPCIGDSSNCNFLNILLARKWLRWLWIWIGFMLSIKAAYQWSLLFIGSDMGFLRPKGGELFTRVMDREACGKFPERWILEWSMSHLHFLRLFSCQWNTHQFFFEY